MKKRLTITVDDNQVSMHTSGPISFEDLISLTSTVTLGYMRQIRDNTPADKQADAVNTLYDAYNFAVSHVLEAFAPDKELRPNLTSQAILEAENAIIRRGGLKDVEAGS